MTPAVATPANSRVTGFVLEEEEDRSIEASARARIANAGSIPRIKRMIRSVSVGQCERIAHTAMTLDSDVQVTAFLRDRARKIVPEAFDGRSAD